MTIEYVSRDSDRFDDDDRARIDRRVCIEQTGYGLPGTTYCETPLSADEQDRRQVVCSEHEQDWRDNYPHYPVIRLAEAGKDDPS